MVATIKFVFVGVLFCVYSVSETKAQAAKPRPVSDLCLGCICAAITDCQKRVCEGRHCGIFTISKPFWVDAGMPVIEGKSPNDDDAYQTCSNDDYCAIDTIQSYMAKFNKDCNGDGRMTCYDYFAMHQYGGYSCSTPAPDNERWRTFYQCLRETRQD